MSVAARLFDGKVALEQSVTVAADQSGWRLRHADGRDDLVAAADLQRADSSRDELRFGHANREGWRLVLPAPLDPALAAALGKRRHRLHRPSGVALAAGLAVAAMIATIGAILILPDRLARHIPLSMERRLGEGLDGPLNATRCTSPDGTAALARLVDRIDPDARRDGLTVNVVNLDAVNAITLPGGRILLFRGLLGSTPDSDAVAGILAHEIAHARRRHIASALVRQLGFGAIVAMVGGPIAGQANTLVNLRFSRGAESEADADSLAALLRANISPRPTAAALRGFEAKEGGIPAFLSDHPASAGRARAFDAAWRRQARYTPALTPADTAALHNICG